MKTIAVDFDGVIHKYNEVWHDGTIYDDPIPGALVGVKMLQKTYAVFVFTTRNTGDVALWLCEHGIDAVSDHRISERLFWNNQELVLVTNRKLPAVAYIDDRAVRFTNWAEVLLQLKEVDL